MELIIVSGRSGAGKSNVLSLLEDLGYYCLDNVPVKLLTSTIKEVANISTKIALSLDVRNLFYIEDKDDLTSQIEFLKSNYNAIIFYLDCNSEVIINRYADTRRSHPLMDKKGMTLEEAIEEEHSFLYFLKENCDYLIDTSELNIHSLSSRINETLGLISTDNKQFKLIFNSFGFKRRVPPSSNFVFDVRHLPNPYWNKELAMQNGLDADVQKFFYEHKECEEELNRITTYLNGWLDNIEKNSSRRFCVVSIGCTGGQHRSVYIADQLAAYYSKKNFRTQSFHFTLNKYKNYF